MTLKWTGHADCAPRPPAYPGDAGYDLTVAEDTWVEHGAVVDVPLGIQIELPAGYWAMITGRSSTLREQGLHIANGILDNGYRGDLFACVWRTGEEHGRWVYKGTRIAQLLLFPLVTPVLERAEVLSDSWRGTKAFGSTGR